MGNERGLPSIPRGLGRELTAYLQAIHGVLLNLSGLSRGSDRALRVSDGSVRTGTVTASIGQASVLTRHLADKAVTSSKMADGCVTADKLAQGAVAASKLASGVLPILVSGTATDGETVTLPGAWATAPVVAVSALLLNPIHQEEPEAGPEEERPGEEPKDQDESPGRVGVTDLREVMDEQGNGTGQWQFEAAGSFEWTAIGYGK